MEIKKNYPKRLYRGVHSRHGSVLGASQVIQICSPVLKTTASGQPSYSKKEETQVVFGEVT